MAKVAKKAAQGAQLAGTGLGTVIITAGVIQVIDNIPFGSVMESGMEQNGNTLFTVFITMSSWSLGCFSNLFLLLFAGNVTLIEMHPGIT